MAKFGSHVLSGPRNGYGPFVEAKPAVCLLVDQDPAETEQKSGGHTVTIFRADSVYGEAPPGYTNHPDPAALARQWWPALRAKWLLNHADFFQCTNEQGGGEGPEVEGNLIHLIAFEMEMMRLANADGFKVCVLNLAGGSPGDIEIWRRVCLPFIGEAWQAGNIYGRHAYGEGDLVTAGGSVIIGNPSRPFEELGYLRQTNRTGGIAITEAGLDGGFGFAGIERFTRQLQGYEKLLRSYPEFIGCCAWTLGNWSEANWQDAMPAMTQYLIDNPTPKWQPPDTTPPPIIPPPGGNENLLPNPSFEGGWWHVNGVPELQIANDFDTEWKDGELTPAGDGTKYVRPEYRVLPAAQLPPAERPLFILDGSHTIKIFKGSGAINTVYKSQPINLAAGTYRLVIPVYSDAVEGYANGQKVFAHDPASADCLAWIDGEQGEWFTPFPFGNWYELVHEFEVAAARPVQVGIRLRNIHALQNSGWFTDAWRLERVDEAPPPPPSTYLHARLIKPANIRRDPSTSKPAITPVAAREGLELIKLGDVIGQPVSGDNRWIKAVAFISRSYATDTTPGKVKTNRPVNLRIVPTTYNNTAIVTLPTGVEFESLGNVKDEGNSGLWVAVALYIWRPLAIDVEPGIRLASPLKIPLTITSPFNAPRNYAGEHEGLDFAAPIGTPVFAGYDGVVDTVRVIDPGEGYGKYVRVRYSARYKGWFGHLSRVDVALNQVVSAGQQIGLSGNSGGSSGPHLHLTIQDIPQGLDSYIISDVIDPTLYMHPAVSLDISPPVPPPGNTYDLLDYMRGDGRQYELQYTWDGGGTHPCQTQRNNSVFYNVKGGGEYEECYYDEKYIYRGIDTSEAPDKYYTQNTGNIYGAMWAKRRMAIGEAVTKSPLIIHCWKDGCRERLRGQPTDRLTLVRHYDSFRFDSGITLDDVVYLEWNQGEGYFYARSFGLVGFTFSGGKSYISEIYHDRPDLQRQSIPCFQPGSRYYAP